MNWVLKATIGALVLLAALWFLLASSADSLPLRLEYDEAYNLQIAESLRRGDGYSTFGALKSGEPWKFDPHITTGPVVMLPVAAVWLLTDGNLAAVAVRVDPVDEEAAVVPGAVLDGRGQARRFRPEAKLSTLCPREALK